jgi:hypothetical protein
MYSEETALKGWWQREKTKAAWVVLKELSQPPLQYQASKGILKSNQSLDLRQKTFYSENSWIGHI